MDPRVGEVLEAAALSFSEYLWTSEIGLAILGRLAREGVEEETVRGFGVGYAPGEYRLVLEHLQELGYSDDDLYAAGIATRSRRGRVHAQFHSRIMFPIRDRDSRMLGFAGMATNPGPSWPLWLTSPDRGSFNKRTAIFAFDLAAPSIAEAGRAVVFRDCLEVLRTHQSGHPEAIAVIRCPITPTHIAQIAAALGIPPTTVVLQRPEGQTGLVVTARLGGDHDAAVGSLDADDGSRERIRRSETELRPDPIRTRSPAERVFLQVARVTLGLGIPLMWLAIMLDPNSPGTVTTFVAAVACVAGTYVILAIVGSIAAARVRARSRARRMRAAW
jgi:hypothetical protein